MENIQREDIYIISRHSNLSEQKIEKSLVDHVYHSKAAWKKFLRLFILSLGIGFTVCGIVFFFAYNWVNLHKFAKLGIAEGLLILTTILVVLPKISDNGKKIILTGASVLVGVIFAVFGQIYQTGANAYDFFLAWSVFISLWVLVANFAPLWLLYLYLINTTIILYAQQVAKDWSGVFVCTILFLINSAVLILATVFIRKEAPGWFLKIVGLAAISYATIGIVIGILEKYQAVFLLLILLTGIAYGFAIWQAVITKATFYLSVIPFSLIIIISALLIKISDGEMFLFVSMFILASITVVIKYLIDIQKKWANEK